MDHCEAGLGSLVWAYPKHEPKSMPQTSWVNTKK